MMESRTGMVPLTASERCARYHIQRHLVPSLTRERELRRLDLKNVAFRIDEAIVSTRTRRRQQSSIRGPPGNNNDREYSPNLNSSDKIIGTEVDINQGSPDILEMVHPPCGDVCRDVYWNGLSHGHVGLEVDGGAAVGHAQDEADVGGVTCGDGDIELN